MYPIKTRRTDSPDRIDSLQALRALAFLAVFLVHVDHRSELTCLSIPTFFALSGFLLAFRYREENLPVSPRACFSFARRHIARLYPLHLITMVLSLALLLIGAVIQGFPKGTLSDLMLKAAMNVLLLQSWVPDREFCVSLNGVAWYLSASAFLYFMFPLLLRAVKRPRKAALLPLCLLAPLLQTAACLPFTLSGNTESNLYSWFMYCFPLFRLGDFWVGCCLGMYFAASEKREKPDWKGTAAELLVVAWTAAGIWWMGHHAASPLPRAFHNWTTVYLTLAAPWVFLFACRRGYITAALTNPLTVALGNLSGYAFLIHFVVIQYAHTLITLTRGLPTGWKYELLAAAELLLSLLLSSLYSRFMKMRAQAGA